MMFSLGAGPGRRVGRIPVVDGPQNKVPPRREWPRLRECAACGYGDTNGALRRVVLVDRVKLVLCVDWQECLNRCRGRVR